MRAGRRAVRPDRRDARSLPEQGDPMRKHAGRFLALFVVLALAAAAAALAGPGEHRNVNGTIWAANRNANTIRGFDASSGEVGATVAMAAGSQPGDLAFAKGKVYVAEEMGTSPAIAIVDARTYEVLGRIPMPVGSRPHHVHASSGGDLVSV